MNEFRVLKIYSKFRYHKSGRNHIVPEIRLQGVWLKELGFETGDKILINSRKRRLIITVISNKGSK